MAEIDGGALSFKSVMDNDQINTAIEETLRRVQGLSDGTVAGGKKMDAAFYTTADSIRSALGQIGTACEVHEKELQGLESEYQRLGQRASAAFMAGRDDEYHAINKQQNAINGEIKVRERLLLELREQSNALEQEAEKIEENKRKTEQNAGAQSMLRTQLMNAKNALAEMEEAGLRGTKQFSDMQKEVGRLQNAMGDANTQAKILSNDYAKLQAVTESVGGIVGAFSVAQGAVGLFAGENENLQKIMTKVQSLMAISIGLQQVTNILNKDSYTQIVLVGGVKEWWASVVAKATIAETAETVATTANTAAKEANSAATAANTASEVTNTVATGAQATAAKVGTVANIGLAGAFRLVGVAIKSIPVFGWIVAGITALAAGVYALTGKQREAKKAQEEFSKELVDGAYQSIGAIENLSVKWNKHGDDLDAKRKFVEENKKAFEELGIAIRDVADAENILNAGKQTFIDAQIAKAKAAIYLQQATEKVKKQMELEAEIAKMSDTKTRIFADGSGTYEVENTAKTKKKKELEELKIEIRQGYENAALEESESLKRMEELGVDAANTYADGTVGAIEQAISLKQEALKLLTDNDEYKKGVAEIEALQKQLEGITGKKATGSGGSSSKDPFLERLEKQKAEYTRFMKWINSGDQIIAKAASKEFAGLLKQGSSYIDFLKNQREQILAIDVANRSKSQNKQLRMLNDQIAEETKKTVLEAFNTELSDQLSNAKTVMEMLNIIAQKRKALANDNTEVDNSKKDTLDEAEKTALQKQKEETDSLLEEYASYLDKKIKLEMDYNNDITLLEKRRSQATTDADKEKINQAIANRTKQYQKDTKGTGDADYDAMVKEYANFEQKKQAIIDEFDEKRKSAVEHGNTQLVEELNKAQAKALSSLAINEMKENPNFEKLFGNLDELTTKKLDELLATFDGKTAFLGVDFDPKDLEAIKQKVQDVKNEIQQRNPFKALISSFKEYSNATDDESKKKSLTKMFSSASSSIDMVKGTFDSVVSGLEKMGITADEQTSQVLNDIGGMMEGASQLAQGIATGNPLQIIQGSIDLITNGIDLIAGAKDRKLNRQIKERQKNVKELQKQYEELERAVDKALGGERYSSTKNELNNLKGQQAELAAMAQAERDKKKTDDAKVEEYENQIAENATKMLEIIDSLREDIMGGTASSIANDLGNAFIDAFAAGEDAADAFNDKVDDVVANIMRKMLIQKLLEQPIGKIIDKYSKTWLDDSGNFIGFDAVVNSAGAMGDELKGVGSAFATAMESLPDDIKKYFTDDSSNKVDTSLTGAVKGVSEETASLVAGQMNAMRINQMEATGILRQQLMHMATIAQNTSYNVHLLDIRNDIRDIKNGSSGNSLRSQGLS